MRIGQKFRNVLPAELQNEQIAPHPKALAANGQLFLKQAFEISW